jgi:hypothetical protein
LTGEHHAPAASRDGGELLGVVGVALRVDEEDRPPQLEHPEDRVLQHGLPRPAFGAHKHTLRPGAFGEHDEQPASSVQ